MRNGIIFIFISIPVYTMSGEEKINFVTDFNNTRPHIYYLINRYRKGLHSMKNIVSLSNKEELNEVITKFNDRLCCIRKSIPFYLMFIPIFTWISLNRLWWKDYHNVIVFDVYSWAIFIIIMFINVFHDKNHQLRLKKCRIWWREGRAKPNQGMYVCATIK